MKISCQKIEQERAEEKVVFIFIDELKLVFKIYSGYIRSSLKYLSPPYNDDAASELLLQQFLYNHCANNTAYYKFLHIKAQELMKIMDERRKEINFLSEDSNTNEIVALSNAFIVYVKKLFFLHISNVSFKLVERYILNCDEEEALAVRDAMQTLESQRNITKKLLIYSHKKRSSTIH